MSKHGIHDGKLSSSLPVIVEKLSSAFFHEQLRNGRFHLNHNIIM